MSTDDSTRRLRVPRTTIALLGALGLWGLILSGSVAHAAACDVNYIGAPGGSWQATANWSGAALPTAAQNVCIPAGAGTIDVPAGFAAKAATVTAQSRVAIAATGTLALSDATSTATHVSTFSALTVQGTLSSAGSWIELTGDAVVDGHIAGPSSYVRLHSGTLSGNGMIEPSFNNLGGTVAPGGTGTVGTLTFGAQYAQQPAGTIALDLASDAVFDQLLPLHGNAFIAGAITVHLLGAYAPAVGTTWVFLSGSPGVQQLDWTVQPSQFVATTIGGGAQLRLAAPPPSGPQPPAIDAVAGDGQATVTVHAPLDHGSENTQGYAVTVQPGDLHRYMTNPGEVVLEGLTNGITYTVTATVTTSVATSAPSAPVQVTPMAPVTIVEPPAPKTTPETPVPVVPPPALAPATQQLLLGCGTRSVVLSDVVESGGRVHLSGRAAATLVNQTVTIVFDGRKTVAIAQVGAEGQFAATAPVPPRSVHDTDHARYRAVVGAVGSLDLKLTRRLILQPPQRSGRMVTLVGRVVAPLAAPVRPVAVSQQTTCGKAVTIKRFTPRRDGSFRIEVPAPAGAPAALYRLTTAVPQSAKRRGSHATYSLPLPILLG